MTAAEEAKQLDSVTDVVQEKELDASKAQEAMSALSSSGLERTANSLDHIQVSKEDVELIVSTLEVTDEIATKTLRQVYVDQDGKHNVAEALRRLVTSG
mmetsp:Transcript_9840/g.15222  ORF Transcript_9840/g.15222 Transcript_9840/m.15222 type:complete len:99 (-) Transcript_9840:1057-1353(-)